MMMPTNHLVSVETESITSDSDWKKISTRERVTLSDAITRPQIDWVLPGLPSGTVGAIVGPGATGKSFLAIGIGAAVGCGIDTLGEMFCSPVRGKVIIFFGEDSRDILRDRLHSFQQDMSDEAIKLFDKNVTIVSGQGSFCELMTKSGECGKFYDVILEAAYNARLLILDPFARLHGADENDNAAMTRMLQILESISKKTGTAILIVHHTGKAATYNATSEMTNQGAARGASALSSGLRWQINMWSPSPSDKEVKQLSIDDSESKNWVRVSLVKANYSRPIPDQLMRRGETGILHWFDRSLINKSKRIGKNRTDITKQLNELGDKSDADYYFPN